VAVEAAAVAVAAVGAEVVVEAAEVAAEAVEVVVAAAAAGNRPGTTHPLSKGGKSHGAIHQYKEKRFMD